MTQKRKFLSDFSGIANFPVLFFLVFSTIVSTVQADFDDVILLSPEKGEILDNGRSDRNDAIAWDFDWEDYPDATSYQLFVIREGATNPVINVNANISSYQHLSEGSYIADQNRSNWTWRVRANVRGEWGDWSETRTFDVEPLNTDDELSIPEAISEDTVVVNAHSDVDNDSSIDPVVVAAIIGALATIAATLIAVYVKRS